MTNVRVQILRRLKSARAWLATASVVLHKRLSRIRWHRRHDVSGRVAFDASLTTDHATASVTRRQVDPDTVPIREWLTLLDQRVTSLLKLDEQSRHEREQDRRDWDVRLAAARDEIRAEIQAASQQGWGFIAWGLGFSLVGTVLGAIR